MPQIVIPDDQPAVLVPSQAYRKLDGHNVRAYDTRPKTPDDLVARIRDAESHHWVTARDSGERKS